MPALIGLPDNTPPWVDKNEIGVNPTDPIWFTWQLANTGDEDGDTNGFYYYVQDPQGNNLASDYAPPQSIPAGGAIEQGARIEGSIFSQAGNYWANLMGPDGLLGGASILVTDPGS